MNIKYTLVGSGRRRFRELSEEMRWVPSMPAYDEKLKITHNDSLKEK